MRTRLSAVADGPARLVVSAHRALQSTQRYAFTVINLQWSSVEHTDDNSGRTVAKFFLSAEFGTKFRKGVLFFIDLNITVICLWYKIHDVLMLIQLLL